MTRYAVQRHPDRYGAQVTTALLVLGLIASFLIVLGIPFTNEDLFLAYCSGRDTMHGLLGAPNQWSYTIPARVWVDQSWLAHLLFYLSYVWIGNAGPLLIKGLLVSAALALVFVRCRALGASLKASALALTLGALAVAPFANIRAHLFGMVLIVILAHLLTLSSRRDRVGQIGSVLVIALWSNVHGSFMVGFLLLGLRAFVEVIMAVRFRWLRGRNLDRGMHGLEGTSSESLARGADQSVTASPSPDVLGWMTAVSASIAVMAFANPYGSENLIMPFRQVFGTERTVPWVDWLPLIEWGSITDRGALRALSVVPVLTFLGCLGILLVAFVVAVGADGAHRKFKETIAVPRTAMEILIPLAMVPLVLKFRRMAVFVVPLLIPVAAVLITALSEATSGRFASFRRRIPKGIRSGVPVALALLWAAFTGFLFYRNVVVPMSPDNPFGRLRPDTKLSSQLLSYNFVGQSVAQFMKQNRLAGRIFSNLSLSDYLLLKVPGIQVFMDLRAHSAYPAGTIEAMTWMMLSGQTDPDLTLSTLDRYRVEYVVLNTCEGKCRELLHGLLKTKRWGCIFQEENGCIFVLARAESPAFRSLMDGTHPDKLWYETPDDRTVAEAIAWLWARGSLPSGLQQRLESLAQRRPDPDLYPLIVAGSESALPCLDEHLRGFFQSELKRLAGESYLKAGGERSIIVSVMKLAEILEADACNCSEDGSCKEYGTILKRVGAVEDDLRRRYRPF